MKQRLLQPKQLTKTYAALNSQSLCLKCNCSSTRLWARSINCGTANSRAI